MKAFVCISLVLCMVAATAGAVEFSFESGTRGWIASGPESGVGQFGAALGALGFNYITPSSGVPFDPYLVSPVVSVSAEKEHHLVLDINVTAATAAPISLEVFFENQAGGFSAARSRIFDVTPNSGWQQVVFDMAPTQAGRDPWAGTITRLRIDPGSNQAQLVGYRCEFRWIAITDDTDRDGIADADELFWFGDLTTASGSTDYDEDGISDKLEIDWGLNPLVDEGETVPVAGAVGLAAMGLALFAAARKRLS